MLYQRHLARQQTLSRWGQWSRTPKGVEGEEVRISSSTQLLKKGLQDSDLLKTAQPKQPKVLWATYLCPMLQEKNKENTMDKNQYNKLERKSLLPAI